MRVSECMYVSAERCVVCLFEHVWVEAFAAVLSCVCFIVGVVLPVRDLDAEMALGHVFVLRGATFRVCRVLRSVNRHGSDVAR